MTIDLESRLREAFDDLPDHAPDAGVASADAISRATRLRRRRSLLLGTALTTGMAAAVAAALVGTTMHTGAATPELRPAAASASASHPVPRPTITHIAPGNEPVDLQSEFRRKRIDGVGGYLLPHGSQLPRGLRYEDAHQHLYSTSQFNALDNSVFLASGLGSDVPGANSSAPNDFGMVASAVDLASNHRTSGEAYGDGDSASHTLASNITRFKSSAYAASAIAKAKAHNGPIIWFAAKTVPLAWSGVPGTNGAHHLYDLGAIAAQEDYLAIQVVGSFIVSASSGDPDTATRAVGSMVDNLRSAKLVK